MFTCWKLLDGKDESNSVFGNDVTPRTVGKGAKFDEARSTTDGVFLEQPLSKHETIFIPLPDVTL